MIDYTHLRHQCHKKLLVLGIITCNLPSCLQFCKSHTTKFTMKRKAGSLIYINWSGGRCTAGRGHYCSRAKSATPPPLHLISSSALRVGRLPQTRLKWLAARPSARWRVLASSPDTSSRSVGQSARLLWLRPGNRLADTRALGYQLVFTDFKSFFTGRLSNKLAKIWLLKISPHLKRVATLPCDLSLIKTLVWECRLFLDTAVLQGSVAMRIRCDQIFNNGFIANFLGNLSAENFENRLRFDEVTCMSWCLPFSWDTSHV